MRQLSARGGVQIPNKMAAMHATATKGCVRKHHPKGILSFSLIRAPAIDNPRVPFSNASRKGVEGGARTAPSRHVFHLKLFSNPVFFTFSSACHSAC